MPKNLFQDMVKKNTRSGIKRLEKNEVKNDARNETRNELRQIPEGKSRPRYSLWIVAVASIVFFLFALSFLISGIKITVNPKIKEVVLNESLSASKDSNGADLFFNLMVISGEENKNVQGGEDKEVSERAKGRVTIFNSFSTSPQLLAIDTRLEGSNDKIYKTEIKTTVPGMSKSGISGSVEVGIYGTEVGVAYNSDPLDFVILGFKGTPKYAKFKVRSLGPISGGLTIKTKVVSDLDKNNALKDLQVALKTKLLKKATDQNNNFILFKDAIFLNTDSSNYIIGAANVDGTVPITLKGTLYGFLFDEVKLTKKIVEKVVMDYDGSEVSILNIRNLIFSMPNKGDLFGDAKNINFNLSGPLKLVWKVDEDKFLADILGKEKKSFNQMLSQYPNIGSAVLSSPFWRRSLPDNKKDIKIIVNYPK